MRFSEVWSLPRFISIPFWSIIGLVIITFIWYGIIYPYFPLPCTLPPVHASVTVDPASTYSREEIVAQDFPRVVDIRSDFPKDILKSALKKDFNIEGEIDTHPRLFTTGNRIYAEFSLKGKENQPFITHYLYTLEQDKTDPRFLYREEGIPGVPYSLRIAPDGRTMKIERYRGRVEATGAVCGKWLTIVALPNGQVLASVPLQDLEPKPTVQGEGGWLHTEPENVSWRIVPDGTFEFVRAFPGSSDKSVWQFDPKRGNLTKLETS